MPAGSPPEEATVREREVTAFEAANTNLADRVRAWRAEHPAGTLRDAVVDLELWPRNPDDQDVHWQVWRALRDQADLAALEGFPEMRAAARVSRAAVSGRRSRRTEREIQTAHLRALADALNGRATASVRTRSGMPPELNVVSHGEPTRTGTVVCKRGENGWRYDWEWGSVISLPDDLGLAAGTITATLEPVQTSAGRAAACNADASCR
jgi:hypothetical protein